VLTSKRLFTPARHVPAGRRGQQFHLLNYGLAVILVFIGAKMRLTDVCKIPVMASLGVVVGVGADDAAQSAFSTGRRRV
jgi:predicted tellurium resistance membrane protein TerC